MDLSRYRFSRTHEWLKEEGGVAVIGITDYAQSQLGDVIFVELPKPGDVVAAGAKFGVIESVKAASDLYSPVGGTVKEVNSLIAEKPELVNDDPYGEGWFLKLEPSDAPSAELLQEPAYREFTEAL